MSVIRGNNDDNNNDKIVITLFFGRVNAIRSLRHCYCCFSTSRHYILFYMRNGESKNKAISCIYDQMPMNYNILLSATFLRMMVYRVHCTWLLCWRRGVSTCNL